MERLKKHIYINFLGLKTRLNVQSREEGFTLVELIVSMGIFAIVMTMFTGFFITMYKLQTDYRATASLNQEARIVSEVFNRYAREAKTVTLPALVGCPSDCSYNAATFVLSRGVNSPASDDITINFDGSGSQLKMNTSNLTSSNVMLTSFKVKRPAGGVYPKVLTYEFTLAKKVNGVASPNPGDKIFFKGYVNMRNEQ